MTLPSLKALVRIFFDNYRAHREHFYRAHREHFGLAAQIRKPAGVLLTIIGDVGRLLHGLLSALDRSTANGKTPNASRRNAKRLTPRA